MEKEKEFQLEEILKYTPSDGGVGYIVVLKAKRKNDT